MKNLYKYILLFIIGTHTSFAQETLPIYQDYLSDNVYLIHPAAAGVGDCGKIRLTARSQWAGIKNAPQLQTLSFHTKIGDGKTAIGAVLFNDKNGYHSQKVVQGTFAYHLEMDRGSDFNQLSFGLSFAGGQNQSDQTTFIIEDPTVKQIIESSFYFTSDLGIAYHLKGLSSYFTIKNLFLSAKDRVTSNYNSLKLRNYILGVGYFFGNEGKIQLEPSLMFQYKETSEKMMDLNFKAYKKFDNTQLWLALSYRQTFDGTTYENAKYISPIIGVNYKRYMFSYTFTKQNNDITLTDKGFHQFSLGYNLLCQKRRASACPNINNGLF